LYLCFCMPDALPDASVKELKAIHKRFVL